MITMFSLSQAFYLELSLKYIEFVSLHNLWGRVLRIVVGLIVLIPLVSGMDAIKESRLSGFISLCPFVPLSSQVDVDVELVVVHV